MDGESQDIFINNPDLKNKNPWAVAGWEINEWPTPWIQSLGSILCGDGAPTFGMLCLKAKDQQYRTMKFTPFNGGFHTLLELHKMRGKFYGPAHMREIWKVWRALDAQLAWVM